MREGHAAGTDEIRVGRAGRTARRSPAVSGLISVKLPQANEDVTPKTFSWHLDWDGIREERAKDGGTYLLRTNLEDCDPKTLWKKYDVQGTRIHAPGPTAPEDIKRRERNSDVVKTLESIPREFRPFCLERGNTG